jgi:hypothetical protein
MRPKLAGETRQRGENMNKSIGLIALPLAFAISAFANDQDSTTQSGMQSEAVEKLKSSLATTSGFEVVDVRAGDDGVSCITYTVDNAQGGSSRAHAVVDGDKVLRESMGNTRFAKAWNDKCVASR